MATTVEPVHSK